MYVSRMHVRDVAHRDGYMQIHADTCALAAHPFLKPSFKPSGARTGCRIGSASRHQGPANVNAGLPVGVCQKLRTYKVRDRSFIPWEERVFGESRPGDVFLIHASSLVELRGYASMADAVYT